MRTLREDGFTLIELLIAMTIFAVGLLSLAGMQITAIRTNSDASVRTASAALAAGILEEILALDRDDSKLDAASGKPWDFGDGDPKIPIKVVSGAGTYEATYSVVPTATTSLARVEVVVSFVNGLGPETRLVAFKRILP